MKRHVDIDVAFFFAVRRSCPSFVRCLTAVRPGVWHLFCCRSAFRHKGIVPNEISKRPISSHLDSDARRYTHLPVADATARTNHQRVALKWQSIHSPIDAKRRA